MDDSSWQAICRSSTLYVQSGDDDSGRCVGGMGWSGRVDDGVEGAMMKRARGEEERRVVRYFLGETR